VQHIFAATETGTSGIGAGRAVFSALCASLVGIGLARFAYSPLIPALIAAGWFTPSEVIYLGAANLAGYLAGALTGGAMAARSSPRVVLNVMMVVATVSFFACAAPISFFWFFLWRFASGVAGGVLMMLAAPTVLPRVPSSRQGLAGGLIFTGVGLGIAASGTLVPLLLDAGLVGTWCGLGVLASVLTVAAWGGWPGDRAREEPSVAAAPRFQGLPRLRALYVEYGLNAVGLVPHMVFLVDFIARGLDRGLGVGAEYWVLFGLGAMVGPVVAGQVADRIGFGPALRLAFVVQALAVGWLLISDRAFALVLSRVIVGAFVPGIVPLVLGRVRELVPRDRSRQQAAWGRATGAFALGQAGGAYGASFLFDLTDSYALLFELGVGALVLALAIDLVLGASGRPGRDRIG
jgi:predicted MFS family arabinose efflux permease